MTYHEEFVKERREHPNLSNEAIHQIVRDHHRKMPKITWHKDEFGLSDLHKQRQEGELRGILPRIQPRRLSFAERARANVVQKIPSRESVLNELSKLKDVRIKTASEKGSTTIGELKIFNLFKKRK